MVSPQSGAPESGVLAVWKRRGETLAVLLERVRREHGFAADAPLTYAGRLDPMADGVVLILSGEARFGKERYLALEKLYRFTALFGIATDTYDALGVITDTNIPLADAITNETIVKAMAKAKEERLPYPPYSSKPSGGVPLFVHARAETLPDEMPTQQGKIETIALIGQEQLSLARVIEEIILDIKKVQGDFRQQCIIDGWNLLKEKCSDANVTMVSFEAIVPSGVYIRSIAHRLGALVGVPAIAHSITRTRVGTWTAEQG